MIFFCLSLSAAFLVFQALLWSLVYDDWWWWCLFGSRLMALPAQVGYICLKVYNVVKRFLTVERKLEKLCFEAWNMCDNWVSVVYHLLMQFWFSRRQPIMVMMLMMMMMTIIILLLYCNAVYMCYSRNQLSVLPASLCSLRCLQVLLLNNNRLVSLPEDIYRLQQLTELVSKFSRLCDVWCRHQITVQYFCLSCLYTSVALLLYAILSYTCYRRLSCKTVEKDTRQEYYFIVRCTIFLLRDVEFVMFNKDINIC